MNEKFLPELSRRLRREGIATGPLKENRLPILVDGRPAMRVDQEGMILLPPGAVDDPQVSRTYDAVAGTAAQVWEYTTAIAAAPPVKNEGTASKFRLLSEFNSILLAGRELAQDMGYEFVTWRRDGSGTGVCNGNYYDNDYAGAKLDFACRSGLVQEHRQFTDEQLTEMYRCIHETLDSEYPITVERRKALTTAAEQIQRAVDDLDERVEQSNRLELEAADGASPEWGMSP